MPAPIGLGTAPSAYRLGHGIQRSAQSIIPAGAPRCAIPRLGFAYMPSCACRVEIPVSARCSAGLQSRGICATGFPQEGVRERIFPPA